MLSVVKQLESPDTISSSNFPKIVPEMVQYNSQNACELKIYTLLMWQFVNIREFTYHELAPLTWFVLGVKKNESMSFKLTS